MDEDARALIKQFLRKWSTIELTQDARFALKEDARRTMALLEVMDADTALLEEAQHAPDRHWFAKQFQEVSDER